MISAPKTVLVVDDEPSVRTLLREALPRHLERFAVATAANGVEAVTYLRSHPVDVLVTDVHMPVMDGFELLAYVRNNHPNLPVVVLSVMAPEEVHEGAPNLGVLRVLRKPASPADIARSVSDAAADTVKGRMSGVPLGSLLELMRTERKSCSLLVRSGDEKGRLHFLSGELVNAYAFSIDADGEEAARHLLGLDIVTIDFERSLHNHERRIETPLTTLLLQVATQRDEALRDEALHDGAATAPPATVAPTVAEGEPSMPPTPVIADAEPPTHDAPTPRDGVEPALDTPAAPSAPEPSTGIGLEAAFDDLQASLSALRARTATALQALDEASPAIERAVGDLRIATETDPSSLHDERRIAEAWREVAQVAERLARAAELLAAGDERR